MLEDLPRNISTFGADIDGVMRLIYWICGIWFAVAELLLLYMLVRFRKRPGQRAAWLPANDLRTQAWVLGPAALVLAFDLYIEHASASAWSRVRIEMPPADVLVKITGRQFAWTFTYAGPDGRLNTADDFVGDGRLRVPQNRVVRFQLEAADVLHSLWIPNLRLKLDAVPGRSIPGWFQATDTGTFVLACAELCGAAHTNMHTNLQVMTPAAFDEWARSRSTPATATRVP